MGGNLDSVVVGHDGEREFTMSGSAQDFMAQSGTPPPFRPASTPLARATIASARVKPYLDARAQIRRAGGLDHRTGDEPRRRMDIGIPGP